VIASRPRKFVGAAPSPVGERQGYTAETPQSVAGVKLLVFDWDGTVVDSIAHITDSWTKAFEDWVAARQEERLQEGLSPCFVPSEEEVKKCIGLSVDATVLYHIRDATETDVDVVREAYRKYFRAGADDTQFFPGAQESLQRLQDEGFHMAVATGKSSRGLNREFGLLRGSRWFTVTRTADCTQSKPHPQMLMEIMEEFDVLPDNTVMIGDSVVDMAMAQRAGVRSIAVAYGAEPREALEAEQPLFCADDWPSLLAFILQNLSLSSS